MWRSQLAREGETIVFSGPASGLRSYLAVAGGIQVATFMGRRSNKLASGFGGFEGILSGAIQVPGDGQPIIILGETASGGYRKIATVISADLPLLGQITPGNEVAFEAVSMEEAVQALREMESKIDKIKRSV